MMSKKNYPETMNAVVAYAPGEYKYETVETPTIEHPKEIVVKVEACGICAGDIKAYGGVPSFGVMKSNLHTLKHL